jgi:signal transduction histidine kinase
MTTQAKRRGPRLLVRAVLLIALAPPFLRLGIDLAFGARFAGPFFVLHYSARDFDRVAEWTAKRVCAIGPARTTADPDLLFALYNDKHVLLSSGGNVLLPPVGEREFTSLSHGDLVRLPTGVAARCNDGHRYAVVEVPRRRIPPREVAGFVVAAVLVLASGAYLFVQAIVRPLKSLVTASEKLGSGDLSVRADDTRGDELGDLARAFNSMAERLEQAVRAEREMIGNIGHELRTPLARMRVVVEWARVDPARAQALLVEAEQDMRELDALLDHVLEAQRIDAGPTKLGTNPFRPTLAHHDLRAVAREAVSACQTAHPERLAHLTAGEMPVVVRADAALLRRAVGNLLENAIRYSDDAVEVVVERSGMREVSLRVRDRGIGMSEDDRRSLFTPFFRAEKSRARRTGGVGLGLVIVKRIAEVHGGSVAVRSALDVGTEVTLTLPVSEDESPVQTASG